MTTNIRGHDKIFRPRHKNESSQRFFAVLLSPVESLPQQVQLISSDMLNQLGKVEFQGALDMAGGVARQNSFGGLWDSFAIRGFAGDENLPSGYLINGFSGGRGYSGNRDTSNIAWVYISLCELKYLSASISI